MKLKSRREVRSTSEENLVPLINIVFLILIFFLVASTIRPFSDRAVKLAESRQTSGSGVLSRAVVVHEDGSLHLEGNASSAVAVEAQLNSWAASGAENTVTLIADAQARADGIAKLIAIASAAGLKDVRLLTRRAR